MNRGRLYVYSRSTIFNSIIGIFIGSLLGVGLMNSCGKYEDKDVDVRLPCEEQDPECKLPEDPVDPEDPKDPEDPNCHDPSNRPECQPDPCEDRPPLLPPEEPIVTFNEYIRPLFQLHCASCHITQRPFVLDYSITKKEIGEIIGHMDPGNKKVMPPTGALSQADRDLVKKFKADGMIESGPKPEPEPDPKPEPDPSCQPIPTPDPDPTPDAGVDQDGIKRIYKPTGKEIALEYGARHENGDRYNVNHTFQNYEVTGYYMVANTEKIEMKTDGPNHSGCTSGDGCMWAEPGFNIADGSAELGAEYPHPTNHDKPCPSCVKIGGNHSDKWIGYKVIAYFNPEGLRIVEQWVDVGLNGEKPGENKWQMTMREIDNGQILPANPGRKLPVGGRGLEAEIRCHGGHGTEMKFGKVVEIIPPK
jgi:hypothetical protein